jgi:hypothetical protein
MPGLVTLERAAGGGTISVRYQALANGALLRYTTRDPPPPLDALRAWFAAQTADHGAAPWDSPASTPLGHSSCLRERRPQPLHAHPRPQQPTDLLIRDGGVQQDLDSQQDRPNYAHSAGS